MAHETLENGKAQTCYIEIAYRNMHKEIAQQFCKWQ